MASNNIFCFFISCEAMTAYPSKDYSRGLEFPSMKQG